jgi:hypothetical protein
MDSELVDYYPRRAKEYEAIYARPERQADLEKLRSMNFVSEEELRERLAPRSSAFSFEALDYYWLAEYRLR